MSAPMVRAILAGRKTQTRREVKLVGAETVEQETPTQLWPWSPEKNDWVPCRFGQSGDRLWVRETWCHGQTEEGHDGFCYQASGDFRAESRWRPSIHMPRWASRITIEVTGLRVERLHAITEADAVAEGVRVAHGRDVPAAMGGGVTPYEWPGSEEWHTSAVSAYREGWESINGPGSWALNPWAWVVEFRKVAP